MVIYSVKSTHIRRWGTNCSFPFGHGSCMTTTCFDRRAVRTFQTVLSCCEQELTKVDLAWFIDNSIHPGNVTTLYFSEGWFIFCFSWIHLWFSTNYNGQWRKDLQDLTKACCMIYRTRFKESDFRFFFLAADINLFFASRAAILSPPHRQSYLYATFCV